MLGVGAGGGGGGSRPAKKFLKLAFSGKKVTQFGQKQITRILFVHNIFFWMIFFFMLIVQDMNILTSPI